MERRSDRTCRFRQRHIHFESTNDRDGNGHTECFNWCELKRVEIVAKEISPASTRCDSCVTDSSSFFHRLVFLPPLLRASQRFIAATSDGMFQHPHCHRHHADVGGGGGGGLASCSFSKITVKVTASHMMSGEKHSCRQRNLPLVYS